MGKISVIYGNCGNEMVKKMLKQLKIEHEISKEMLIGLKPNLVLAKPSSSGATTDPMIVEGIIEYLYSKGYKNLVI